MKWCIFYDLIFYIVLFCKVYCVYISTVIGWHVLFCPLDMPLMVTDWHGTYTLLKKTWWQSEILQAWLSQMVMANTDQGDFHPLCHGWMQNQNPKNKGDCIAQIYTVISYEHLCSFWWSESTILKNEYSFFYVFY